MKGGSPAGSRLSCDSGAMTRPTHATATACLAPHLREAGRAPFAFDVGHALLLEPGASLPFLARDLPLASLGSGFALALTPTVGVRERAAAVGVAIERISPTATAPGAVIADHTAAWIWCGGDYSPSRLIVASERHSQRYDDLELRKITLATGDIAYPAGIPTLAPHRAFAELARKGADETARIYAERLVAQGWVTSSDLTRIACRACRSGRGNGYSGPRTGRARYKKLAALAKEIEKTLEGRAAKAHHQTADHIGLPSLVTR